MLKEEDAAIRHHDNMRRFGNRSETMDHLLKVGWMSNDEKVLGLLKDGYQQFRINMALRILREHSSEIFFNNCPPRCDKLARTPKARQCRYCSYSWHEE